jgi:isoquinoline 1-oxidoreductase beta subunit
MVSEVSVADGNIKVHRVFSAIDSGYVVHPDACRAQAEGNVNSASASSTRATR